MNTLMTTLTTTLGTIGNQLSELTFVWVWVFVLLPLPLLLRYGLKPVLRQGAQGALKVPFFTHFANHTQHGNQHTAGAWWRMLLLSLIWGLLVTALARPTLVGRPIPLPIEGRDVMLAIDLSGSMDERDLAGGRLNRLDVVKAAADTFIERRKGDRMGLILFSDRAYLQAPLTFDRQVVRELLREAQVGLTGKKTAIGDAIAVALKRLKDRPNNAEGDSRVLVLLTDGANTAGVMPPMQAAELAKKLGIRIYTIGVGSQSYGAFGRGNDLDEATLTAIADTTGGEYFRATDARTLDNVYRAIDRLVPSVAEPVTFRPEMALFTYPAGLAVLLTALLAVLSLFVSYLNRIKVAS